MFRIGTDEWIVRGPRIGPMAVFAAAYRDHADPEKLLAAWGLTGQHERLGCRVCATRPSTPAAVTTQLR